MEEKIFEKKIREIIISNNISAADAAEEITVHVREFHDWLAHDNTPNAFEQNYEYWINNVKK